MVNQLFTISIITRSRYLGGKLVSRGDSLSSPEGRRHLDKGEYSVLLVNSKLFCGEVLCPFLATSNDFTLFKCAEYSLLQNLEAEQMFRYF